jgi:competence protein ComEC
MRFSNLANPLLFWAWPAMVLGFIGGSYLTQQSAVLPAPDVIALSMWLSIVFSGLTLIGLALKYAQSAQRSLNGILLVAAFFSGLTLGGSWAMHYGAARVAYSWPSSFEGKDISATGYVANMPTLASASQRVFFVIESNDTHDQLNGKTVSLSWYYGSFELQPAQRYRLTFRAKQRHGGMNPQGFDYELWLVSRGIAATGYIRTTPVDLNSQTNGFLPWVERGRTHVRERLFASALTPEAARWAAALALGDQRSLNDADWQRYNATGTGHLLAVSGTHITLMGALLAWLAGKWWQSSPARLLRLPLQTLRLNVMLGSSWIYALMAGWALPAQRTVLMLTVAWLALRLMPRPSIAHVMASSAAIAVGVDPIAVISPSFWLSYGAVAALVALEAGAFKPDATDQTTPETLRATPTVWQQRWQALRIAASSQVLLTLALIPLGAVFFNQISVVSPLANAIAIPVMGWVSTPLALLAALLSVFWSGMAGALMQGLLAVQQGMDWVLDLMLTLPYAQLFVPSVPIAWSALGLAFAVGCVWLKQTWRYVAMGGMAVYIVGAFFIASQPPIGWRVAFLDVGQGMAVAVHSQGKTLLFDTGPRYSADSDGAARVIVPYLRAVGVNQLDHVIISHADDDHAGGARSLMARMHVHQWWHSLAPQHPLMGVLPKQKQACEAGKTIHWAGLSLQWLHPAMGVNHDGQKTNAMSCVLRISDSHHSVLLAADIEAAQEQQLIQQYGAALASTVLLAPHHGSKTSSTEDFIRTVNPKHVVIQNGYRNRFGHPHPTVSQRYADAGIKQWRSDADGAIIVDMTPDSISLKGWRAHAQRYWHTVMPSSETLKTVVDGSSF